MWLTIETEVEAVNSIEILFPIKITWKIGFDICRYIRTNTDLQTTYIR